MKSWYKKLNGRFHGYRSHHEQNEVRIRAKFKVMLIRETI